MCYICNYKCASFVITFANISRYKLITKYFQIKNTCRCLALMKSVDIKKFRKANGMTQQVLADYLGITQAFVSNMEAGRDTIPEKYIRKILDDPNVDSSMLSGGEEENITLNPRVDDVKMPREVFDKISQLIDTVCSQQGTIASQQDLLAKMQYVVDKSITPPLSPSRFSGWGKFRGK